MKEIIDQTLKFLENNQEWVERYKGYIEDIKKNGRYQTSHNFHKPAGLSIYSTVSKRNVKCYDLRFEGQSVAEIHEDAKGNVKIIGRKSNEKYFADLNLSIKTDKDYDWDSIEAQTFRKNIKTANGKQCKVKSPEHKVENTLLKEFSKRSSENKGLCNIQPVRLYNMFFQMPTPLKASDHKNGLTYAKQYGGGIDILARVRSIDGAIHLSVMEVKDENMPNEPQKVAMEQAMTYATFIAQLLKSESGQNWWDFFMGRKNGKSKPMPQPIHIDVVTIMPNGDTDEYVKEKIERKDLNAIFHCHSLYYDNDSFEKEKIFKFDGTYTDQIKKQKVKEL